MKLMKAHPGQALVEYVMVIALVAIMLISSLVLLRRSIGEQLADIPELGECGFSEPALPPGHGGIPPGHGGVPPGQSQKPPGKCKKTN